MIPSTDRDEELARALQAQFQIEAESSLSRSTNNMSHGPRPHPASRSHSDNLPSMNLASPSTSNHKRTNSGTRSSLDEQYNNLYESHLRQLEAGGWERGNNNIFPGNSTNMNALTSGPRIPTFNRSSPRTSPRGSPRGSPRNSFHNSDVFNAVTMADDEAMARRLEQELLDAELASSIERAERAAAVASSSVVPAVSSASAIYTNSDNNGNSRNSSQLNLAQREGSTSTTSSWRDSFRGRALYFALRMLVVVLVAGITFIVYVAVFGKQVSDNLDPATWLPGYPENDPSLGSVGKNAKWIPISGEVEGNGLTLQVLNNLAAGSDWDEYFRTAMDDWDNGTPDAVTLTIRSMSSYDSECQAVRRAMKVCNGNYGPTDWRGVNQILLQDNYIVTSLAKMNDYYLEGTDIAQKQYTMCHELGHGLGLGHADENFYNADLGNCMDYTERPQNNMHPDETNYQQLAEMYGTVYVTSSEEMDVPENRHLIEDDKERGITEEEFRVYAAHLTEPIEVSSRWMAADRNGAMKDSHISLRLLLKSESFEHHEMDLGNGYSIRTSILLA